MTNTHLKYLDDTYAHVDEAMVSRVGRDDRGPYVVLDQTIFYPQGGGQPSDTGTIQADDTAIDVSFAGFGGGEVFHYVAEEPPAFDDLAGRPCTLRVDRSRRLSHARIHTAGHLVSGLIDAQRGPLRALKGFHFPDGPYVEFAGKPEADAEPFLASIQAQIDALLAENPQVTASTVTYDELAGRCWTVPPNLPRDKPLRVVTIGQLDPVPCGGTHVASLAEIGAISVVRMKSKKGNTKISYTVESAGAMDHSPAQRLSTNPGRPTC